MNYKINKTDYDFINKTTFNYDFYFKNELFRVYFLESSKWVNVFAGAIKRRAIPKDAIFIDILKLKKFLKESNKNIYDSFSLEDFKIMYYYGIFFKNGIFLKNKKEIEPLPILNFLQNIRFILLLKMFLEYDSNCRKCIILFKKMRNF